jgi:hypothetical protein
MNFLVMMPLLSRMSGSIKCGPPTIIPSQNHVP